MTDENLSRALEIVNAIADVVRDDLVAVREAGARGAWSEINRLHKTINRLAELRGLLVALVEQKQDAAPWQAWLEDFWANADFGPAHEDVVDIMYAGFKERTGIVIPDMEHS